MNLRLQILSDVHKRVFCLMGFMPCIPRGTGLGLFAFRLFVLLSLRSNLKYVEIGRSKL